MAERAPGGVGLFARYHYDAGGLHAVTAEFAPDVVSTHTVHRGALGSTLLMTDGFGDAASSYRTDPWGRLVPAPSLDDPNALVFTGHQHDAATGLIYMKSRMHDPALGAFLSQDSYLGRIDLPASLHRYLYAYGNPGAGVDPDGREFCYVEGQAFFSHFNGDLDCRLVYERKFRVHADADGNPSDVRDWGQQWSGSPSMPEDRWATYSSSAFLVKSARTATGALYWDFAVALVEDDDPGVRFVHVTLQFFGTTHASPFIAEGGVMEYSQGLEGDWPLSGGYSLFSGGGRTGVLQTETGGVEFGATLGYTLAGVEACYDETESSDFSLCGSASWGSGYSVWIGGDDANADGRAEVRLEVGGGLLRWAEVDLTLPL